MTIQTLNLTPPLYEYLLSVSLKEASILKEIREKKLNSPPRQNANSSRTSTVYLFTDKVIRGKKRSLK